MTVNEFSNQFDVLYNNITSNQAPGLNEYEKSVFLTKAQDEIVKNYFNPKSNPKQEGFDDTAKRQADFSNLLRTEALTSETRDHPFDDRAKYYKLPSNAFIVINEMLKTDDGYKQVIPISYDEYTRLMSKPFKRPTKNQAWRLITEDEKAVEIILPLASNTITSYTVRYIVKPKPILLYNPADDYANLTIDGSDNNTYSIDNPCDLDSALHEEVLQRAVELAKIAWEGSAQSAMTAGARSE